LLFPENTNEKLNSPNHGSNLQQNKYGKTLKTEQVSGSRQKETNKFITGPYNIIQ